MSVFSSEKESKSIDRIETLIGEQCNIVGNLNGSGVLKIDGSVDGDTMWQDDIILGISSVYNGNISCKNALISGKVNGNIICEETLTIETAGKIKGDITVKKLLVREGGSLDGKCTMIVNRDANDVLD